MEIEVLRLRPGTDLRGSLEAFVAARNLAAGFIVSAVGSLSRASLRYAGKDDATLIVRPFEIVSLTGTLSPQGCHLHASVSDDAGDVLGGHVLEGCIVRTTAEIVVGIPADLRFSRELDPQTGYRELTIRKSATKD
jgi:predicted DNA-binding protein with PD1-like motif